MGPRHMCSSWTVCSGLLLVTCAAGCTNPTPRSDPDTIGSATEEAAATQADARYVTHLLFAGTDGSTFFGAFDQSAEQSRLTRRYDAWWSDGRSWQPLARSRDTLPVPRAAWRILPVPDMAVRVGDAGQMVSLTFTPHNSTPVRLDAREAISVWTGPTGQRESLGLGVLQVRDSATAGILFFRRAARALRIPPTAGASRTFVLADSIGNGILLHTGDEQQPTVAHTWLHGTEAAWSSVILETLDSTGTTEQWNFRISGTDLRGNIRTRTGVDSGDASSDAPPRASPLVIECVLFAGDEQFRFLGLSARLPLP